MLWSRFGLQRSGDPSPVADLMIPCHKRDLAPSVTLAADLPVQGFLVGWPSPTGRSRLPTPGATAATPFALFIGGVAGLADGYAKGGGEMWHRHRRWAPGLSERLDPTYQLIEIRSFKGNLSDHPVTGGSTQRHLVNMREEPAERGIGWHRRSSSPSESVGMECWRPTKCSRSPRLWQWLRLPCTANISSSCYAENRTPYRVRASGIALRQLIRSRWVEAAELLDIGRKEFRPPQPIVAV